MGSKKNIHLSKALQFLWVLATAFISMAFVGNLKSTLVKKSYEPKTQTLNEMIDKDMPVFITIAKAMYLERDYTNSPLNKRLLCQVKKTKEAFTVE